MIKNKRYDPRMTTLGSLFKGGKVYVAPLNSLTPRPLDLADVISSVALLASAHAPSLGPLSQIVASITAWTEQDDDAHEPCSLTACRHPLHPGPCKGWKGTLHSVAPGTYHQVEAERVRKANDRRLKRIADLKAQNKPIPRRLLDEIKPKAAPVHPANNAQAMPLGQVGQKADLAGGQAHASGQAVSKAAGVTVKTAPPLPLGPKAKKPTVAGRGPAFVITQPKVTDQYKLDKAAKITPQEWDALSPADKKAIRDELAAIKVRGFGPQQTKADALLAKLPAASTVGNLTPGTPGTVTTPKGQTHQVINAPGKTSLGQATKSIPAPAKSNAPATPAAPSTPAAGAKYVHSVTLNGQTITRTSTRDYTHASVVRKSDGTKVVWGFHGSENAARNTPLTSMQRKNGFAVVDVLPVKREPLKKGTPDGTAAPATPATPAPSVADHLLDQIKKAQDPSAKLTPAARSFVYRRLTKAQFDALDDATKKRVIADLDDQIANGSSSQQRVQAVDLKNRFNGPGVTTLPAKAATTPSAAPSTPSVPKAAAAPALSPDAQNARAVAGRAVGRPTSKTHVDAYGKLTKADFDQLDATTQRTIRDDLANAKAKFLDPAKQQAAQDLLNRFGSKHPAPVTSATPGTTAMTPTNVAGLIRKDGSVDLMLGGKKITTGFAGKGHEGELTMAPGGHYVVTTKDGTKHNLAKGQMVTVATKTAGTPAHPKGYSDPQNEAVKLASGGGSTDDVLKRVGALSPTAVKGLDDTDRDTILKRLAFIATHPQATKTQKDRATAYGRIINKGSTAQAGLKLDHEPSLGELHAEEEKTGAHLATEALNAAADTKMPRDDRIAALGALSKSQFTALPADDQRKITDALQSLHLDKSGYDTKLDSAVGAFITTYTGQHPALHRLQQAEADYRAKKITGDDLEAAWLTARVQAPGTTDKPGQAAVIAEAARIAKDNPSLPTYARVRLAGEQKYGNTTYAAISLAGMKHNWEDAPRFSSGDFRDLFRPTEADLAAVDPIHADAVRALQNHVLATGLATGSPWSTATKGVAIDALVNVDRGFISPERLALYKSLPDATQFQIRRVLRERQNGQNSYGKTSTWIVLRELEGRPPLTGAKRDAALAATDTYAASNVLDIYRKLDPQEYDDLPTFTQDAIRQHLAKLQDRAEASGGIRNFTPADNPFKVMPAALTAHLAGSRTSYADRSLRNASDVVNYGTKVVTPADRIKLYSAVSPSAFRSSLAAPDRTAINADLTAISRDSTNTHFTRFDAAFTRDILLGNAPAPLNADQIVAIASTRPSNPTTDANATAALNGLDAADYAGLERVYREAIDERIKTLPGGDQQILNAKFHPAAAAANPSGMTPTTVQANVPPHVQEALDTIYGVHPKSHTMAQQLKTYGALRGSDFAAFNAQEQNHLLSDLSFIATTAKGPSADKAKKLIDRFTPPGTPSGQVPTPAIIPPANSVPGQVRYATPLKGLAKAKDSGKSGDGWITLPGGQRVWGAHGAAGLLLQHVDPQTGEKRYLMVQRGPAISDPGKWTFPGGASDSKETPHQGATRETIEELGLKDDVFKDALVHGDHTFTIPGSTWKYTTVAAQVPSMIKPDLSTAHARAETSDAKWLTLSEIQALDQAGKLHGPIAGGKLEQNVISLYPTGTPGPTTLGQVARPGPVTKRLGRLTLPSGGRQAPAQFNAWPHAHKPSTGKDLIADKTAFDAMRQTIKQDRALYDGKTADGRLAAIGAKQGFDDTPTVLDKKEIDRLLATGDYIEAWRGVSGAGGWSARSRGGSGGKTAADINEEMRSGPAYYGKGIFGNGYYLATQRRVANQYADGTKGSVARILIPKSAITQKYDKVSRESHKNPRASKAKGAGYGEISTFYDPGRYAAAKGIDGIEIEHHHVSPGGGARHVAQPGQPAFNWLNRSVLIIQKEPG